MSTVQTHIDAGTPRTMPPRRGRPGQRATGVYPDPETRAALMAIYDARLARWPVPFQESEVPTRYGRTHIISAGDPAAPPLLLLHMAACPSFLWAPIIEPLSRHYRTYAIDTIGDIGKSELADTARYPKSGADYSVWLNDVSDALDLDRSDVVAGSMGGWIALHHAVAAPRRVGRLALLAPMGLPSWFQTMRTLSRMTAHMIWTSQASKEQYLTFLIGHSPVAWAEAGEWISAAIDARCMVRLGFPFSIPGSTLEAVRAPTFIVLGGRDELVGKPARAMARARAHIRDVRIELLPNSGHGVFVEEPKRVATRILDFLAEV